MQGIPSKKDTFRNETKTSDLNEILVKYGCYKMYVALFLRTCIALKYGDNDLGSIMIEENVVSQAGATYRMGVADMKRLISELGYEARQRDNWYQLVT